MKTTQQETVAETFIDHGADLNATSYRETPLELAIKIITTV